MVVEDTKSIEDGPQTLNEAWNHPNVESWRTLKAAIEEDFNNIKEQQVWKKMLKSLMPPYCSCVKKKWVVKI